MKTFGRDELLAFFAEIDELLAEPAAIEIVGGAAALLAYGASRPTKDVDCFGNLDDQVKRAAEPFQLDVILDRFRREMGQATIDPRILELQFAHIVEALFGPAAARKVSLKR